MYARARTCRCGGYGDKSASSREEVMFKIPKELTRPLQQRQSEIDVMRSVGGEAQVLTFWLL